MKKNFLLIFTALLVSTAVSACVPCTNNRQTNLKDLCRAVNPNCENQKPVVIGNTIVSPYLKAGCYLHCLQCECVWE